MHLSRLIISVGLIVIFAGCKSVEITNRGNEEVIFPQVAEAFSDRDYAMIETKLSSEVKEQLTRETFNAMLEDLAKNGRIVGIEYVGSLRQPLTVSELWKITMLKDNNAGEEIFTDKMLRVVIGNFDGRRQIIGLVVQ